MATMTSRERRKLSEIERRLRRETPGLALLFEHHHRRLSAAESSRRSCLPLPVAWLIIAVSLGLLTASALLSLGAVTPLEEARSPSPSPQAPLLDRRPHTADLTASPRPEPPGPVHAQPQKGSIAPTEE
ncbi:DUF3040 domain-containing protein [Actinomadura darangshiensis]|nr:DUF3040 domain-containing protein [Actinomadura darangshiensis]